MVKLLRKNSNLCDHNPPALQLAPLVQVRDR